MAEKRRKQQKKNSSRLLAMVLIGSGLLVFGLLALVLLSNPGSSPNASAQQASGGLRPRTVPVSVDFPAPDLELNDLAGNPVSLAGYRGQFVLVNNWATWCPPCREEMPVLQAYYEKHQAQGFTILAIEAGEPVKDVASFVEDYQLTFPVWPDPQQKSLAAFKNLSLPNSYVIDPDGQVRLAWTGAVELDILEQYLTPLLEE